MKIKNNNNEDSVKFFKEEINYCDILSLYVPDVEIKLSEDLALDIADLLLKIIRTADNIMTFRRYLQN